MGRAAGGFVAHNESLTIFRADEAQVDRRLADYFLACIACLFADRLIHIHIHSIQSRDRQADRAGMKRRCEFFLALAQRRFRPLAIGDVASDPQQGDDCAVIVMQRRGVSLQPQPRPFEADDLKFQRSRFTAKDPFQQLFKSNTVLWNHEARQALIGDLLE